LITSPNNNKSLKKAAVRLSGNPNPTRQQATFKNSTTLEPITWLTIDELGIKHSSLISNMEEGFPW